MNLVATTLAGIFVLGASCQSDHVAPRQEQPAHIDPNPETPPTPPHHDDEDPPKDPIAVSISAADFHTCAVKFNGETVCFGGQNIPDVKGHKQDVGQAKVKDGLPLASEVFSSRYHNCIRTKAEQKLDCWGPQKYDPYNFGQASILSRELASRSSKGVNVSIKTATVAAMHSCVILLSGEALCAGTAGPKDNNKKAIWTYDLSGKLKDVTAEILSVGQSVVPDGTRPPFPKLDIAIFSEISSGPFHTCGISSDKLECFGIDTHAERFSNVLNAGKNLKLADPIPLSDLLDARRPTKIILGQSIVPSRLKGRDVIHVSAGFYHTCAITKDDNLVDCWPDAAMPPQKFKAVQIASSAWNTCVIVHESKEVKCFAVNTDNQNAGWINGINEVPTDVGPATHISVSPNHACAIRDKDGSVVCWGAKNGADFGQINVPAELAPSA